MLISVEGSDTLVSPLQPKKVFDWIAVTLGGIVIVSNDVQFPNTPVPKVVTLDGIVTLASAVQVPNAEFPTVVNPLGRDMLVMAIQ